MKQRNYLLEDIKKVSSEENKGHRSIAIFLLACCTLFLCAAALFEWNSINSYVSYNTETMHYVKAQVVRIEKETLEYSREDQRYLGTQTLTVQLMEGNEKGEEIEIDNYLTRIHNIHVSQGSRIIVCADTPQDAAPYYTVFNYDRSISLLALIIVFFIVMVYGTGDLSWMAACSCYCADNSAFRHCYTGSPQRSRRKNAGFLFKHPGRSLRYRHSLCNIFRVSSSFRI